MLDTEFDRPDFQTSLEQIAVFDVVETPFGFASVFRVAVVYYHVQIITRTRVFLSKHLCSKSSSEMFGSSSEIFRTLRIFRISKRIYLKS